MKRKAGWSVTITIAAVQMDVRLMVREANLSAMESALGEAAGAGAKLVIFPEAAVTGYCYQSLAEAMPYGEAVPGESIQHIGPVCRELGVFAIYGTLERVGDHLHNVALLVGPEGLLGCYRKMHLPYLGIDRFTSRGQEPAEVYELAGLRLGMLICYDLGFPEAARCLAVGGADLVVLITNSPPEASLPNQIGPAARAWENQIYFVAVNRIGHERGVDFIGQSRICDPWGQTLAEGPEGEADILYAQVDPEVARQKRRVIKPGQYEYDRIADRRPELYGRLVEPNMEQGVQTRVLPPKSRKQR